MIKAILFDMDGVIFDTEKLWRIAYNRANKKYGLKIGEKFRRTLCGKNEQLVRKEMKQIFLDVDIDGYRDYTKQQYLNLIQSHPAPIKKGFLKLIQYLKDNNYPTALVSASTTDKVEYLFKKAGFDINKYFDFVLTGDMVKVGKPDPYVYLKASKELNYTPQECAVLEDSPNGIMSSHSAGCYTIMVVDLIKPDNTIRPMCDKISTNLNQVLKLIKQQQNT